MKYEFEIAYGNSVRILGFESPVNIVWMPPEYVGLFVPYNNLGFMSQTNFNCDIAPTTDYEEMLEELEKFVIGDVVNYELSFVGGYKVVINKFLPVWYSNPKNPKWNEAFNVNNGIIKREEFDRYFRGAIDYDAMLDKLKRVIVKGLL